MRHRERSRGKSGFFIPLEFKRNGTSIAPDEKIKDAFEDGDEVNVRLLCDDDDITDAGPPFTEWSTQAFNHGELGKRRMASYKFEREQIESAQELKVAALRAKKAVAVRELFAGSLSTAGMWHHIISLRLNSFLNHGSLPTRRNG